MTVIHVHDLELEPQHIIEQLLRSEQYEDDDIDFDFEVPKKKKSRKEEDDE